MGSKGHFPAPQLRRPFPGPGLLHPDPVGLGIHPPAGVFPFDMMPSEIIEEKLATQHVEMQRLATENGRLASTHSSLRQGLAVAQQEVQRIQNQMVAAKTEQEKQINTLLDKITKMEADLKSSDTVKVELQQAHAEAQNLFAARQDLSSQAQQLTQDLQRNHGGAQQIPALISELDTLRQEYQRCRTTYDYERKLRIDHHESLQVMQKNYASMVTEVEKLRTELANAANYNKSDNNALGAAASLKENSASKIHSVGPSTYGESYSVSQGHGPSGSINERSGNAGGNYDWAGYGSSRGPGYDASRLSSYDASQGGNYEAPKGSGYDPSRARGTQATAAAGNSPTTYSSMQAPSKYGVAQASLAYGHVQKQSIYGSQQPSHGSPHQPAYAPTQQASYASTQYPTHRSASQHPAIQQPINASIQQTSYRSAWQQTHGSEKQPPPRAGGYEAHHSVKYTLNR